MTDLSIIIPCRDEEENVNIIYENIKKKIETENYQIIFINDFSSDNTENKIKELSTNDKKFFYTTTQKGFRRSNRPRIKKIDWKIYNYLDGRLS